MLRNHKIFQRLIIDVLIIVTLVLFITFYRTAPEAVVMEGARGTEPLFDTECNKPGCFYLHLCDHPDFSITGTEAPLIDFTNTADINDSIFFSGTNALTIDDTNVNYVFAEDVFSGDVWIMLDELDPNRTFIFDLNSIEYIYTAEELADLLIEDNTEWRDTDTLTFDDFLNAIEWIEPGGHADAIGDNGRAVGAYQIHKIYVDDVNRILKKLSIWLHFSYEDRWDKAQSRRMIEYYVGYYALIPHLNRHVWRPGDLEKIARIHNGGPTGHTKDSTKPYWEKVKAKLEGIAKGRQTLKVKVWK